MSPTDRRAWRSPLPHQTHRDVPNPLADRLDEISDRAATFASVPDHPCRRGRPARLHDAALAGEITLQEARAIVASTRPTPSTPDTLRPTAARVVLGPSVVTRRR
jgi:hypothetical protein